MQSAMAGGDWGRGRGRGQVAAAGSERKSELKVGSRLQAGRPGCCCERWLRALSELLAGAVSGLCLWDFISGRQDKQTNKSEGRQRPPASSCRSSGGRRSRRARRLRRWWSLGRPQWRTSTTWKTSWAREYQPSSTSSDLKDKHASVYVTSRLLFLDSDLAVSAQDLPRHSRKWVPQSVYGPPTPPITPPPPTQLSTTCIWQAISSLTFAPFLWMSHCNWRLCTSGWTTPCLRVFAEHKMFAIPSSSSHLKCLPVFSQTVKFCLIPCSDVPFYCALLLPNWRLFGPFHHQQHHHFCRYCHSGSVI